MKKWTFIAIIMAIVTLAGCNEQALKDRIDIYGGGYQGIEGQVDDVVFGRLGYRIDPNISAGIVIVGEPPLETTSFGIYGAWYPPVGLDIPVPGDISWLPEDIRTDPYIMLQGDFDPFASKLRIMPIPGVEINDIFIFEYWKDVPSKFSNTDEDYLFLGLHRKF